MKKILIILLLSTPFVSIAQQNISGIVNSMKKGDAVELTKYFDSNVEVTILENSNMYSKQQAMQAVRGFFTDHQPTNFQIQHQGNSKSNGSQYAIGTLNANSKKYRVFILSKDIAGIPVIQQLQIETD